MSELPSGFVWDDAPDGLKWDDAPEEKPFGVTDTWPFRLGRGLVRSLEDAATLPGDVYTGKQDVEDPSITGRALNFGALAMPQAKGRVDIAPSPAKAPPAQALHEAGAAGYETARASNVALRGDVVAARARSLQTDLRRKGMYDTSNSAPTTHAILKDLEAGQGAGAILTAGDYINLRQALQEQARRFDSPHESGAATVALKNLDELFDKANSSYFVAGTPAEIRGVRDAIKEARANFAAGYRSDTVTGKAHEAEIRSAAANSGKNFDNTLRQRLAGVALSRKQNSGFSPDEIKAMEGVIDGTLAMNATRNVSNLLGGGGGLGRLTTMAAGAGAGGASGDLTAALIGGVGLPAAGWALKKTENALTRREVKKLDNMLRLRSPEGRKAEAAQARPPATPLPYSAEEAYRLLLLYQAQNPDSL
jgi:hypothetical protein